jgi:hypothetical protein
MDRYTKTILTIIAAALIALAVEQATPRALAMAESCGMTAETYCYVHLAGMNSVSIMGH